MNKRIKKLVGELGIDEMGKMDEKTSASEPIFDAENIMRRVNAKLGIVPIAKRPRMIWRRPAAVVAIIACFAMVISAAAIMLRQQYIPSLGFVESEGYEIYYTPEILQLGEYATVETVMRVKDGKKSELSIIVTDMLDANLKITTENHGEFELIPKIDYGYSSLGTLGKFQFYNEGDYSSYGYLVENFPEINEFTLVCGEKSVQVQLVPNDSNEVLTAENSGVRIKFYSMSKGSKVLAYEIEDSNLDMTFPISDSKSVAMPAKTAELQPWAFKLYGENGNEIEYNGYHNNIGPNGTQILFLRTNPEEKISKITVESVNIHINTLPMSIFFEDGLPHATPEFGINIPVPADGEKTVFDNGGLAIFEVDDLTGKIESVERKGNELTFYTKMEYDELLYKNVAEMYISLTAEGEKLDRGTISGPGFDTFKYKQLDDQVKLFMTGINYVVNGNWEITFD